MEKQKYFESISQEVNTSRCQEPDLSSSKVISQDENNNARNSSSLTLN